MYSYSYKKGEKRREEGEEEGEGKRRMRVESLWDYLTDSPNNCLQVFV